MRIYVHCHTYILVLSSQCFDKRTLFCVSGCCFGFLAGNFEWQAGVILSRRLHHWSLDSKHMDLREQQDYGSRGKALRNDGVLSQVAGRLRVILWFAICERTVHRHQRAYAYAFPDTVFGSGFSPE